MQTKEQLSLELLARLEKESVDGTYTHLAFPNDGIIRRKPVVGDTSLVWRPGFSRDIDKIMHCPY